MKIGDRVMHADGDVGIIEEIEDPWPDGTVLVGLRWQTPLDVPSALLSWTNAKNLMVVPDSVKPIARSEEWMAEARAFCAAIVEALRDVEAGGE